MTLGDYVRMCGSQEHAAQNIGVSYVTINRWLRRKVSPGPLAKRRLASLGVVLSKRIGK